MDYRDDPQHGSLLDADLGSRSNAGWHPAPGVSNRGDDRPVL